MDTTSPKFLRARIDMFRDVLSKVDAKDNVASLLRNGVFPKDRDEESLVAVYLKQRDYSGEPLSFSELCTFNTWFARHPEKVCGREEYTNSREFPITIKGTEFNIKSTLNHALGDFQLILELPGEWIIKTFYPEYEDFFVQYACGKYMIQVFTHGMDYNFQINNGDFLLENINYRRIEDAIAHALKFMNEHPVGDTKLSELEIEALALELEMQIKRI
jgi:hypothetical protein